MEGVEYILVGSKQEAMILHLVMTPPTYSSAFARISRASLSLSISLYLSLSISLFSLYLSLSLAQVWEERVTELEEGGNDYMPVLQARGNR